MPSQLGSPGSRISNRFGFGCLALFALPFVGLGLFALIQGVKTYSTQPNAFVPIMVGGIFTAVGLLIIVMAWRGSIAAAHRDELQAREPDKPWMWRDDWRNRVIEDSNKSGTIGFWFFAVLWNAISFPIAFVARDQVIHQGGVAYIVLLFPFVGVILLISAIYMTMRSLKFGTSKCHLDSVPIVPGRAFRGDIELKTDLLPSNGFQLRIASIHSITTRSGKNRSTTEHVLWDDEIVVDPNAAMRSPLGTRIPFQFATPPDAHVTDESDSYDKYLWRIYARAELPGVDYAAQFDVPVFQTGEAVDGSEFAAFEERQRAAAARQEVRPASGVEITKLPGGGEEFRIHAPKTFGATLRSVLFLGAWNAAIVAMIHFKAPWGVSAVFIVLDLLFLAGSIDYYFGRSTITVDTTGVRVRREWLGIKSTQNYEASSVVSIDGQTAASNSFGVMLQLRDSVRPRLLGGYMKDRASADAIAAKMMADLRPDRI